MTRETLTSPEFLGLAALAVTGAAFLCRRIGKLGLGHKPRVLSWSLVLGLLLLGAWTMDQAQEEAKQRMRALLQGFAPTYARELESLGHARLSLRAAPDDPLYLCLIEAEKRWLRSNPAAADIYTFRRLEDGTLVLAVDAETDYDHDGVFVGDREQRTAIGEVYDVANDAIHEAFEGRSSFSSRPSEDRWGTWVSAFEPIHDERGRVEAVVGVDFPAETWLAALKRARRSRLGWLSALLFMMQSGLFVTTVLLPHLGERRRVERDLVRAHQEAEEASRVKSLFLATMSHELRTPLSGILGMGELLEDTPLDPEQREMLQVMGTSGRTLLAMIEDVLDYSRIESGGLELESTPVDLTVLAEELSFLYGRAAENKGVDLVLDLDPRLPARVSCDGPRVRQVLGNLLSNAVKFTSSGEIVLQVELAGIADGLARLVFRVQDTGIGIPAASFVQLFKPFSQVDASLSRRFGGTGLGLATAKHLVTHMGGRIEVESVEGRGSVFTVRLGFALVEPAPQPKRLPCHVLVVSSSEAFRTAMERLARARVEHVDTIRDAVGIESALRRTPKGQRRMVLVDSRAEGGPGSLAGRLVALGVERRELVLLGRTKAIQALDPAERGSFGHEFHRPITSGAFAALLATDPIAAPEPGPALPATRPTSAAEPTDERRALVVDDHASSRKYLVLLLESQGWSCTAVSGGALAVEATRSNDYHAVLMDMAMPDVDGYEAGRRIRELEQARHRPRTRLIAVTALQDPGLRQRCFEVGFDDWLEKPVDPEVLLAVLSRAGSRS